MRCKIISLATMLLLLIISTLSLANQNKFILNIYVKNNNFYWNALMYCIPGSSVISLNYPTTQPVNKGGQAQRITIQYSNLSQAMQPTICYFYNSSLKPQIIPDKKNLIAKIGIYVKSSHRTYNNCSFTFHFQNCGNCVASPKNSLLTKPGLLGCCVPDSHNHQIVIYQFDVTNSLAKVNIKCGTVDNNVVDYNLTLDRWY